MNDTMGIILTGVGTRTLGELTMVRSLAALPMAGRYRLIDFVLSDMVNSGITNVGVATTAQYRSLMDHLGTGKAWDLNRKIRGLTILPPYLSTAFSGSAGNLDILNGILDFLQASPEEYVILAASDTVYNTDFFDLKRRHIETGADITVAAAPGAAYDPDTEGTALCLDGSGRITDLQLARKGFALGFAGTGTFFMRKDLLCELIGRGAARGLHDFVRDLLLYLLRELKVYAWVFPGKLGYVDSVAAYYRENMRLLNPEVFHAFFKSATPILTKVKDQVPTVYGPNAVVKNCIIADGCVINGRVENCILFRGVNVSESACVTNSIVMQKAQVSEDVSLECVILDKNVLVRRGKKLTGQESYPVVIRKNAVV